MAPLVAVFVFSTSPANAVILLSGDTNITDILVGGQGLPIDAGNQQFFINILQGGISVVALEEHSGIHAADNVNAFYNSLPGLSSTVIDGPVTNAALAGTDLFISAIPSDAFTTSEITAMDQFLAAGGSIFFLGDNEVGSVGVVRNGYIKDALAALGSELTIVPNSTFGTVLETATGSQIADDPLTAGITSFSYLVPSQVGGGTTLFFSRGAAVRGLRGHGCSGSTSCLALRYRSCRTDWDG
jgi:hypothetical protein